MLRCNRDGKIGRKVLKDTELQQHLHQGRLTHEILVTIVGKPVDEYYCMDLRKLQQQNGKKNTNLGHLNEMVKVAWDYESHERLHCRIRLKQVLRLRLNYSRVEHKIENGTVQRRWAILQSPKQLCRRWMGVLQESNVILSSHKARRQKLIKTQLFPKLRILRSLNPWSLVLRIQEKSHLMAKITHTWIDLH